MQFPCQPPQKEHHASEFLDWRELGQHGRGSGDQSKVHKRTAHKVCNYAVHSGISGKRKGTRRTMPFISNVVWSCLAEGTVKYCLKSLALGVDIGRWGFVDSPKLDVTHNTIREHSNKRFKVVSSISNLLFGLLGARRWAPCELRNSQAMNWAVPYDMH